MLAESCIYQVSTFTALLEAELDGDTTYREIKLHGDFGLGTFNGVDGEMIALDGEYYQLHAGGSVSVVHDDQLTPFAAVTYFNTQTELQLPNQLTEAELFTMIDSTTHAEHDFFAIRVDGAFAMMHVRCPRKASKPYPSLLELTKSQVEVTLTDVTGSIVGFKSPQEAQGTTVAGYHLHFITTDRTAGGHVLGFTLRNGVLLIDHESGLFVDRPEGATLDHSHLTAREISQQIEESEGLTRHSASD